MLGRLGLEVKTTMGWVHKARSILSWVLVDEGGFLNWLLPLGLGVLGFMGQQQAASTAAQGSEAAREEAARMRELQEYMMEKRKTLYDPIERDVLIPKLTGRSGQPAAWAPQAGFWAKQLSSRMAFPTKDVERRGLPAANLDER